MSRSRFFLFISGLFTIFIFDCSLDASKEEYENKLYGKYDKSIVKWAHIFSPSVFPFKSRLEELNWFRNSAKPFSDITIRSVGENIETSYWESQFLARAFYEITGIRVLHFPIEEDQVVTRLMEQLEENKYHYDIYVCDADLVGTHLRMKKVVVLSDYMKSDGKKYTNPELDLQDFLNLEFGQDYDGNQLQIPDYQFSTVYWFRHDWFSDENIKSEFRKEYGYDLGVPLNWAAYEDIAKFFTGKKMRNSNDSEVIAYGHADFGLSGPWLGWRFSDAFMSAAGMGDVGLPNGFPVDEWGIRVENKIPVGASVERGGAINGPAAVYALTTWINFLYNYAPVECRTMHPFNFGFVPARGDIAQTWFWPHSYIANTVDYNKIGSPVCDNQGNPVWRIAPIPQGRYWQEGMKIGYQDAGSWTIPITTSAEKRDAAWLWAQFCISKSVALKRFINDAALVRKSTLYSEYVSQNSRKYGGLIEFARSPAIKKFTDSGPNVAHYPKMSRLWWNYISQAIEGKKTPQTALDLLAQEMDKTMAQLDLPFYTPVLNEKKSREYWLQMPGSPKASIDQRPEPKTILYEELLSQWEEQSVTNN